ncbi:hypothetical protein AQZ52_15735 [Novosphingobium fuchskuhlense]|uniref:DUF1877 domain-containing protein n=1 Tax=Novosphingobium fuchskuhlense TaxID=1117702 RepID=A0A117UT04_9SPHN|nr:DUF1877 family protein [Novosphingobium fuchskuhlense]KUR70300.1 hypothetical protein AQZ52_15735 [Novosphingobium fuchskuhlense]
MGMYWSARLVDEKALVHLLQHPEQVYDFFHADQFDGCDPAWLDDYKTYPIVDMGQEWHALHYVLTGSADTTGSALDFILGSFSAVGEDLGYGPAHVVPPRALSAFSEALSAVGPDQIAANFASEGFGASEVYLGRALASEGHVALDQLNLQITKLAEFVSTGAARQCGAITLIT